MEDDAKKLVTVAHLKEFKDDIIAEMKLLVKNNKPSPEKKWLKSKEVRKQLGICSGTLQTMRNSGKISFIRMGGVMYYDQEDIDQIFIKNRVNAKS